MIIETFYAITYFELAEKVEQIEVNVTQTNVVLNTSRYELCF